MKMIYLIQTIDNRKSDPLLFISLHFVIIEKANWKIDWDSFHWSAETINIIYSIIINNLCNYNYNIIYYYFLIIICNYNIIIIIINLKYILYWITFSVQSVLKLKAICMSTVGLIPIIRKLPKFRRLDNNNFLIYFLSIKYTVKICKFV